jgi:hypothetical protein
MVQKGIIGTSVEDLQQTVARLRAEVAERLGQGQSYGQMARAFARRGEPAIFFVPWRADVVERNLAPTEEAPPTPTPSRRRPHA